MKQITVGGRSIAPMLQSSLRARAKAKTAKAREKMAVKMARARARVRRAKAKKVMEQGPRLVVPFKSSQGQQRNLMTRMTIDEGNDNCIRWLCHCVSLSLCVSAFVN